MMMRHVSRLGLALALTLGLLSTPAFAGDVEGALKYVPANFTTVVAVDFDAVRKSPFFDMATAMLDKNKGAKSIEHELGLDAKKDLKTFVLAGPEAFMHHEEQFVVIIDAKIDGDKLIAYVKSQSGSVTEKKVGAASVYVVDKEGAFAVDGKFVIAGYAPLVEQALAAKAGKSVGSGPLASLVKRFKGSKGGFAISGGGPRPLLRRDPDAGRQLRGRRRGLDHLRRDRQRAAGRQHRPRPQGDGARFDGGQDQDDGEGQGGRDRLQARRGRGQAAHRDLRQDAVASDGAPRAWGRSRARPRVAASLRPSRTFRAGRSDCGRQTRWAVV